jgi:hypothetical protein
MSEQKTPSLILTDLEQCRYDLFNEDQQLLYDTYAAKDLTALKTLIQDKDSTLSSRDIKKLSKYELCFLLVGLDKGNKSTI